MTERCPVMLKSTLISLANPFVGLINVVKGCFVPKNKLVKLIKRVVKQIV